MTTTILLNAIPAVLVIATLTLVCWLPSRLRRDSAAAKLRPAARPARSARQTARRPASTAWRARPTGGPEAG